jgi:hypothetical protein
MKVIKLSSNLNMIDGQKRISSRYNWEKDYINKRQVGTFSHETQKQIMEGNVFETIIVCAHQTPFLPINNCSPFPKPPHALLSGSMQIIYI